MKKEMKDGVELKDYNLYFEPRGIKVKNNIARILEKRNIPVNMLSRSLGIPRQSLYIIMDGSNQPGIEYALKIASALDVSVEDLFELSDEAWFETAKDTENRTLYFDHYENCIKSGPDMASEDKNEFFEIESKTVITREQYIERKKDVVAKAVNDNPSENKKQIIERFELNYIKRFEVLFLKINPNNVNL